MDAKLIFERIFWPALRGSRLCLSPGLQFLQIAASARRGPSPAKKGPGLKKTMATPEIGQRGGQQGFGKPPLPASNGGPCSLLSLPRLAPGPSRN